MEKEIEYYNNLENQIDKISDLVIQLKEENRQLREQNEQLMIQLQSTNGKKRTYADDTSNESMDVSERTELTNSQYEMVRQSVKNALLKLDQLRQAVMEAY